jgi:four helix bundle protein
MITNYKELNVWQEADKLAGHVFDLTAKFPRIYLYDLTSQLRRAALSVPTNIAEGCASFHTKEFLQFLNIARRSLSETRYLLDFAHRRELIDHDHLSELEALADSVARMLNALIRSLRTKARPSLNTIH